MTSADTYAILSCQKYIEAGLDNSTTGHMHDSRSVSGIDRRDLLIRLMSDFDSGEDKRN